MFLSHLERHVPIVECGTKAPRGEVQITSDASGSWGCGAFTSDGSWFQLKLPESWKDTHITVKELLPIVISIAVWGRTWQGRTVARWSNNAAVVMIVNSGRSKAEVVMHVMRCLSFFLARWDVSLTCSHIPGVLNGATDALSRNPLSLFQRLVPSAKASPTTIPEGGEGKARLDKGGLNGLVRKLFINGLADSTNCTYSCGQRQFLSFCQAGGFSPTPASEDTLQVCGISSERESEAQVY